MDDKILEEIRQVSKEYPDGIHKRSEAKEMFEKLGYKEDYLPEWPDILRYTLARDYLDYPIEIMFSKNTKTFVKQDVNDNVHPITLEELQAINKQIEELGWLNE